MSNSISDVLTKDFCIYTQEMIDEADNAAKKVRRHMKNMIKPITPYRDYSKTGPEDNVARQIAADKGHLADKWGEGTIKSKKKGTIILKRDSMYYAVRSRNKPMLVHLLNFPHKIVLWGRPTNRMTTPKDRNGNPVPFVDEISAKGEKELDQELVKLGLKRGNP